MTGEAFFISEASHFFRRNPTLPTICNESKLEHIIENNSSDLHEIPQSRLSSREYTARIWSRTEIQGSQW